MKTRVSREQPKKRKYTDADLNALWGAIYSLNQSTSWRMLRANMDFLIDYFLVHPSEATSRAFDKKKAQRTKWKCS